MSTRDAASAERDESGQAERTSSVRLRTRDPEIRLRHDMRSSVHTLLGFANLLVAESHGPLTPEQRVFVEHMQGAAHELERLVDIQLELARPERAGSEQSFTIDALLPRLTRRLRMAGIRCEFDPPESALSVSLDVERFERAWLELARLVCRAGADCTLRCIEREGGLALALHSSTSGTPKLDSIDACDRDLDNRTALTLHFVEALLGASIVLDRECSWFECGLSSR